MHHGIDAYFAAIAGERRRIGWIGLAVSAGCLCIQLVLTLPVAVDTMNDPKRFGFEGPDEYVHRILLETIGPQSQPGNYLENVAAVELHAGGGRKLPVRSNGGLVADVHRAGVGSGPDEVDLTSRARALALAGPVIRSEDLVVERLVRPDYPEDARNANIEGVVELFALVDTTGDVTEVHIAGGTHDPSLERAATSAVLQCRYRPYRLHDYLQRVWAYFRIRFTLY